MSLAVNIIWQELMALMIKRNPQINIEELRDKFEFIRSNAKFITGLNVSALQFTVSVEGQAIGAEMFYDPLLKCWKMAMRDALEQTILSDITLSAGVNAVKGMGLRYKGTDDEGQIVENDLVITGLFTTEPRGAKFDKYEIGVESSKYAFTKDDLGNSPCALMYFTNVDASDTYASLINGENGRELMDLDDLDYKIEVS